MSLVGEVETAEPNPAVCIRIFDLGWLVGVAIVRGDSAGSIMVPLLPRQASKMSELLERASGPR